MHVQVYLGERAGIGTGAGTGVRAGVGVTRCRYFHNVSTYVSKSRGYARIKSTSTCELTTQVHTCCTRAEPINTPGVSTKFKLCRCSCGAVSSVDLR